MSASDFIARKKYSTLCNVFKTKDSSSETIKKELNTIRCTQSSDVYGIQDKRVRFDIPLPANMPVAVILMTKPSTPIVYSAAPLRNVPRTPKQFQNLCRLSKIAVT